MQDRQRQIDEILLRRTAGPYIRVMSDKAQAEHSLSALPPIADMKAEIDFRRSGPQADIAGADHAGRPTRISTRNGA